MHEADLTRQSASDKDSDGCCASVQRIGFGVIGAIRGEAIVGSGLSGRHMTPARSALLCASACILPSTGETHSG
eukprot:5142243-Pleurochrysis_carterae.AAC.2